MVDMALQDGAIVTAEATARARAFDRLRLSDVVFRHLTRAAALGVLVLLSGVIVALIDGSLPALRTFGFGFLIGERWNPVTEKFGALAPIYGTLVTSLIAMLIAVPVGLMIAFFLTELCPQWLRRPIGIAIELLAGIPSIIYGIWGLFVFAPFLQQTLQPFLIDTLGDVPGIAPLFSGPPYGIGMLTAGLILAIMVLPFVTSISRDVFEAVPPVLKEAAYGVGCTTWEVVRYVVLPYARVGVIGGVMLGLGRALGRDHGGDLRHRQRPQGFGLAARARHHHFRDHRQRVHRGGRRPLHLVADRARAHPVRHHLHRARGGALSCCCGSNAGSGDAMPVQDLPARYAGRRRSNAIAMALSLAATVLGLGWLVLILGALLWHGFSGLSLAVFTQMTPPPGSAGGLLNPIIGSLMLTVLAVVIGTPIGILAGTYMAEYGRYDRLTIVVRFINDILLSAPSIVIGLFIYEIMVAPMGHFSGWAGAVALAVIVIPVVVRTTEDMLTLVPNALREAATSIGLPRSMSITHICYRAARAGMITGVLLAVARVSGETAPLLFTSLNNQFWSTNLNAPIASLPVVIFQFALSPYKDWQTLAWTGALIITLAVLALSITARALVPSGRQS